VVVQEQGRVAGLVEVQEVAPVMVGVVRGVMEVEVKAVERVVVQVEGWEEVRVGEVEGRVGERVEAKEEVREEAEVGVKVVEGWVVEVEGRVGEERAAEAREELHSRHQSSAYYYRHALAW
jgi:hypothetical protein